MEKFSLELTRKIAHIISGIMYLLLYLFLGYSYSFMAISLFIITIGIIGILLVRKNQYLFTLFKSMIRQHNPIYGIGVPMFFGGMFVACFLHNYFELEQEVIVYAITTLAIGDGVATIVGKSHLGICRPIGYQKSYSGLFVGIIMSVIVSGTILLALGIQVNTPEILVFVSIGMIIEFVLVQKKAHEYCIDNFAIPVGIVMSSLIA